MGPGMLRRDREIRDVRFERLETCLRDSRRKIREVRGIKTRRSRTEAKGPDVGQVLD